LAPTPKTILEWLVKGEVSAGAMSLAEFNRYRTDFRAAKFRILYTDFHPVPPGSVLVGAAIERNQQEQLRKALLSASPATAAAAGYITNAKMPDYEYLMEVVQRVLPIAQRIREQPVPLY
jgi:phosphonate transport system substrate-binding protein